MVQGFCEAYMISYSFLAIGNIRLMGGGEEEEEEEEEEQSILQALDTAKATYINSIVHKK